MCQQAFPRSGLGFVFPSCLLRWFRPVEMVGAFVNIVQPVTLLRLQVTVPLSVQGGGRQSLPSSPGSSHEGRLLASLQHHPRHHGLHAHRSSCLCRSSVVWIPLSSQFLSVVGDRLPALKVLSDSGRGCPKLATKKAWMMSGVGSSRRRSKCLIVCSMGLWDSNMI